MVRFFPHEISQTNFFSTKSGYVHWNSFNNDYQAQSIHFFRGMYYLICNSIDVNNRMDRPISPRATRNKSNPLSWLTIASSPIFGTSIIKHDLAERSQIGPKAYPIVKYVIVRREYCEEEFGFPQHKFLKSIGGKARHVYHISLISIPPWIMSPLE